MHTAFYANASITQIKIFIDSLLFNVIKQAKFQNEINIYDKLNSLVKLIKLPNLHLTGSLTVLNNIWNPLSLTKCISLD